LWNSVAQFVRPRTVRRLTTFWKNRGDQSERFFSFDYLRLFALGKCLKVTHH
jgi:hypothetical protein